MLDTADPSLDDIRAIPDLDERAAAVSAAWQRADERLAAARDARDAACLHLLRNEGWKPVKVYRLAGLSRRLFGPIAASCRGPAPQVPDAETRLPALGQEFWVAKRAATALTALRKETALALIAAGSTNAHTARATNLSSARVMQIRRDAT